MEDCARELLCHGKHAVRGSAEGGEVPASGPIPPIDPDRDHISW